MHNLNTLLSGVDFKVRKVIESYQKEKEKNEVLSKEKVELLSIIENQQKVINDLVEKNKILKLKNVINNSSDSTAIKLKINELLREIDRCIDLFTQKG